MEKSRSQKKRVSIAGMHIDRASAVPIYLQIVNQVKYLVASGRLAPGEELPPIRVLAERLVVNPNTVARAYRDLQGEGLLEPVRGTGLPPAEIEAILREEWSRGQGQGALTEPNGKGA